MSNLGALVAPNLQYAERDSGILDGAKEEQVNEAQIVVRANNRSPLLVYFIYLKNAVTLQ
ncbi:hypothetical protein NUACC21_61050 [Scytonema sp. NUACC21]